MVIPNGSLLKQNRPYGVIKEVNSLDFLASRICQNPLLASSLLNITAPVSCARVVSTFGIGCISLRTFSLSGFISTHIRTAPEAFGTTTIAAHQGVGSLTRDTYYSQTFHALLFCLYLWSQSQRDISRCT